MRLPSSPVGLALTCLLAACLDPTQATLVITTNVDCGPEEPASGTLFETGVNAAASRRAAAEGLVTSTRACSPDASGIHEVGDIVIFPESGANEASAIVVGAIGVDVGAEDCLAVARGERDDTTAASCIIAPRTVPFADHAMLRVPILLDRFCAGVICAEGTTCVSEGGSPRCVDDRVACGGSSCELDASGGGSQGGGGAGGGGAGGGGGGSVLDCSAVEPIYLPTAIDGPTLETIVGVEGYYPDRPLVLATGYHQQVSFLYELDGMPLTRGMLASGGVGLDAAIQSSSLWVAIAEESAGQLLDLGTMSFMTGGPGQTDIILRAADSAAFAVDGGTILSRIAFNSYTGAADFTALTGPNASLTALTSFADRIFAVGSHVCIHDLGPVVADCGAALTEPWADAWAASQTSLFGLGADFVDVTDQSGGLVGPHDLLPKLDGQVSLRKLKGVAGTAPQAFFVAGNIAQEPGVIQGYLARGEYDGATITWSECALPGIGGLVDLWVSGDGTEVYFVTADGAAYRANAAP